MNLVCYICRIMKEVIRGRTFQFMAYGLAIGIAGMTYYFYPEDWDLWFKILIADITATLVIFIFSRVFSNSSFYDPYWSIQPIVIALFLGYLALQLTQFSRLGIRQVLVIIFVSIWGLRLTFNFFRTWRGLNFQDWRYDDLQEKHKGRYWIVSFLGIHMLPTVLVFMGCLPMLAVYIEPKVGLNILDIFASLIVIMAILTEAIADEQLHRYKLNNPPKDTIFSEGLWSMMRHPNYLGELLFWWGIYLLGLSANSSYWWTIIGPISITVLFLWVSIPMIDNRMLASRPAYREHMKRLRAIIPKF